MLPEVEQVELGSPAPRGPRTSAPAAAHSQRGTGDEGLGGGESSRGALRASWERGTAGTPQRVERGPGSPGEAQGSGSGAATGPDLPRFRGQRGTEARTGVCHGLRLLHGHLPNSRGGEGTQSLWSCPYLAGPLQSAIIYLVLRCSGLRTENPGKGQKLSRRAEGRREPGPSGQCRPMGEGRGGHSGHEASRTIRRRWRTKSIGREGFK